MARDRAQEILEECLGKTPEERAAFLAESLKDNLELRARVMEMLASHQDTRQSKEERTTVQFPDFERPEQIGAYKILQTLGEGGMGVVYEAEQTEPVRRRVALKLIRVGMDSREVVARFEAERQALAVMNHPNIAGVLDAGTSEDGRPFFVMELVRGIPILDYCDRHSMRTNERLELFQSLCAAVQHAHQKGVVHRDLKPSNVLVTEEDKLPVVKVIDFGIAKAIGQKLTEKTIVTHHGQAVGTPAYMSPEQAEMSGLDVDTRSDIYSLGVILYELLSGSLPSDPQEIGVHAFMVRLARGETDPPPPSSKLQTRNEQTAELARLRTTDPFRLKKELEGDLDWIVMRAIEYDRTRRYQTAAALAEDLNRYMKQEPVLARPPSRPYKIRKFVARNKISVATAALAALAVLAGIAGTTIGLLRAKMAETSARLEAETAREVSDFLVGLFRVTEPGEARGSKVTARELLDRGAERIERELQDQPEIQSKLLATMSEAYRALGLYNEAVTLGEKARTIQTNLYGENDHRLAATLGNLAASQQNLGNFEESQRLFERALDLRIGSLEPTDPRIAEAKSNLAALYWQLGQHDRAWELHTDARTIREAHYGPESEEVAYSLRGLGFVASSREDSEVALDLYLKAQSILETRLGTDHPVVADNLDSLGIVYAQLEDYATARECHERALAIRKEVFESNHPTLGYSYLNLGRLAASETRSEESIELFSRGLHIWEESLGPNNPRTVSFVESLAIAYARGGDLEKARPYFERSLAAYEESYGPNHPETLESLRNMGILCIGEGKPEEAMKFLRLAAEGGYAEFMDLESSTFNSLRHRDDFEELVDLVGLKVREAAP